MRGLYLPSFLGWLTGVYFIAKPWGKPRFTSYCHPYSLYALLLNVGFMFLWKDYYHFILALGQGKNLTNKIIMLSTSVGIHFFNGYMRACFFIFARKISALIHTIDTIVPQCVPKSLTCVWRIFGKLFCIILIYYSVSSMSFSVWFYNMSTYNLNRTSMFFPERNEPPPLWYYVIFWVFGAFPTATCAYFTFCFIFILTFRLICLFEHFSDRLKEVGRTLSLTASGMGIGSVVGNGMADIDILGHHREHNKEMDLDLTANKGKGVFTILEIPETDFSALQDAENSMTELSSHFPTYSCNIKEELLDRFDTVKNIFCQYDAVVGPLVLGVLIRNVFTVINGATGLIVNFGEPINVKQGCSFVYLLGDIAQFLVLELGSWAQRRINACKEDLEKMIVMMPSSAEKKQLGEVVKQVRAWQWHLNACHFFRIERQLMAGIVSTMLTYIVILFQLHVSEVGL